MILITILALGILTFVGKLIYDVQQNKKKSTKRTIESGFDVDTLQKLAGIKGEKTSSLSLDVLKREFENTEFPASDPSVPATTTKLTTIGGDYSDNDPLAQIPMSRVSKEAKQKMAEIAKEDISKRLEETNKSIFPEVVEYADEYYKSTLPKRVKEKMLKAVPSENDQRIGVELVKPKRKNTNKNKK
jgi:hypothetical protein